MGTDQNNDQLRIRRLEQKVRDLEAALAGSFATLNGLQAQEEMFRLLVTHMPDVAWTSDDRGRTIYISPRVEEVYGYSPEEVLAKGEELWFGRVHDDDRERIRSAYEAMFASGAAFDIEYRIRHRQGHWIWLHDRAFARFSKEGRRYAHGVFRDITEQKRLQAARDEADRLLRGMIDAAPFGAHLYELQDGRLVFIGANRAADRILGVDHRQFYGKFIEDAFPPLKDTDIPAAYRATAEHGTPFEQNQVNYENGQIRGAFEVVTAQLGQGRMAAFFRDITERKRGEEALREEKNRSDAILAAIGDGISIQDRDYRVLYQNEVHKDIIITVRLKQRPLYGLIPYS